MAWRTRVPDRPVDSGAPERPAPRVPAALRRVLSAVPPPHRWPRDPVALAAACALSAGVYTLHGLTKLRTFRTGTYDLTIFDQTVRAYAHFRPPVVPLLGVTTDRGMDYLQLADHFSPILAVLAPLYWLHDGPATLIVAQAVLFALAIPFLWAFTRRRLGTAAAYLVAFAYALSWPIAQTVSVEFHEVAFVPVLTAAAIERLDAGKRLPGLLALAGLLLTKEDAGLIVAGVGAWLFVTRRRRLGAAVAVGGLAAMEFTRKVLIPLAGGRSDERWYFSHLGADLPDVLRTAVTDPLRVLGVLVEDQAKIDTTALLLWPTLFLCLLSPIALAALPHVAERMLSDASNWWSTAWHYDAFTVAILFLAGVDGAARLIRWVRRTGRAEEPERLGLVWAAAICAVALTLVPHRPFGELLRPDFYAADARAAARHEALALIPDGVLVEASNDFGPHLSGRDTVLWWDYRHRGTPWIIASAGPDLRGVIDDYVRDGYRLLFDREDIVVLRRAG
ncbi:DUF2079 domain-containing protein [Microtetraspora niveoalba]|uniref:DUF2079 domain-containing protein n=1 Tax=Microtetraspora niveoalba TaxID=46175 RepID=UPI000A018505|nr:DUF2079 domain-containing protein [Microtetraspora niveoalba]